MLTSLQSDAGRIDAPNGGGELEDQFEHTGNGQ